MKKFKHIRNSRFTAYQMKSTPNEYQICYSEEPPSEKAIGCIDKKIIEETGDWEEIIERPTLFITEDGVEIREGDRYYFYNICSDIKEGSVLSICSGKKDVIYDNNSKRFSNPKIGEEYLLKDKKLLSINKIIEIMSSKPDVKVFDLEYIIHRLFDHLKS